MKVLQINAYFGNGSTGKLTKDLYDFQKNNNIESYVAYAKDSIYDGTDNHLIKMNNKFGFYIHKYLFHLFGKQWKYSYIQTKRLLKRIDLIKPDIIHLHNLHDYYINITLLFEYIKKNSIPVVWTFHDCWAITGHCSHFITAKCYKWEKECNHCPMQRKGPRSMIFDNSKKCYYIKKDLFNSVKNINIVTVSDWEKYLVKRSFLSSKPVETIYNWINTDIFKVKTKDEQNELKRQMGYENKKIILGVAPYWTDNKGINDLIELSDKISDEYLILLIGKNVHNYKFRENIIHIDYVPNSDLRKYYVIAVVFLNLSKCESFGLTTVEALSCGTPVIAYNLTACPEVIGNSGECGYVIDFNNDRINNIIDKIYKIDSIDYINKCKMRVNELFDEKKNLQKYIDLYNKIYYDENGSKID